MNAGHLNMNRKDLKKNSIEKALKTIGLKLTSWHNQFPPFKIIDKRGFEYICFDKSDNWIDIDDVMLIDDVFIFGRIESFCPMIGDRLPSFKNPFYGVKTEEELAVKLDIANVDVFEDDE
jgi:hypothetical protein